MPPHLHAAPACVSCLKPLTDGEVSCDECHVPAPWLVAPEDLDGLQVLALAREQGHSSLGQLLARTREGRTSLHAVLDVAALASYDDWPFDDLVADYRRLVELTHGEERNLNRRPERIGLVPDDAPSSRGTRHAAAALAVLREQVLAPLAAELARAEAELAFVDGEMALLAPSLLLPRLVTAGHVARKKREAMAMLLDAARRAAAARHLQEKSQIGPPPSAPLAWLGQHAYFAEVRGLAELLQLLEIAFDLRGVERWLEDRRLSAPSGDRRAFELHLFGKAFVVEQFVQLVSWKTCRRDGNHVPPRTVRAGIDVAAIARSLFRLAGRSTALEPWILLLKRELRAPLTPAERSAADGLIDAEDRELRASALALAGPEAAPALALLVAADARFAPLAWLAPELAATPSRAPLPLLAQHERSEDDWRDLRRVLEALASELRQQAPAPLAEADLARLQTVVFDQSRPAPNDAPDLARQKDAVHRVGIGILLRLGDDPSAIVAAAGRDAARAVVFDLFWLRPRIALDAALVFAFSVSERALANLEGWLQAAPWDENGLASLRRFDVEPAFVRGVCALARPRPALREHTGKLWVVLAAGYAAAPRDELFETLCAAIFDDAEGELSHLHLRLEALGKMMAARERGETLPGGALPLTTSQLLRQCCARHPSCAAALARALADWEHAGNGRPLLARLFHDDQIHRALALPDAAALRARLLARLASRPSSTTGHAERLLMIDVIDALLPAPDDAAVAALRAIFAVELEGPEKRKLAALLNRLGALPAEPGPADEQQRQRALQRTRDLEERLRALFHEIHLQAIASVQAGFQAKVALLVATSPQAIAAESEQLQATMREAGARHVARLELLAREMRELRLVIAPVR